jgi:hypothetical protein
MEFVLQMKIKLNTYRFQGLKKAGYKLYFLACDSSDGLLTSAQTLDATLTKNGLEHTFYHLRAYMG